MDDPGVRGGDFEAQWRGETLIMTGPETIAGSAAWRGDEMARSTRWLRPLDERAVEEIDAALRAARAQGVPWHETTRDSFPLPTLAAMLAEVARELEDGGGLVTLRGLPVARYALEELRQIWLGTGAALIAPGMPNARGAGMAGD